MIQTQSNIALITKEECFTFFDAIGQPLLKTMWEKRENVVCKELHDFTKGDSASWVGAIGNLPYRAVVILGGVADISTSGQKVDFKARPLRVAFDTPVLPKEYSNLQVGSRISALAGLQCDHIVLKSYGDNRYRLFNTKGLTSDGKELTVKYDSNTANARYIDQYEQDSDTAWSNNAEVEAAMQELDELIAKTGFAIESKKSKAKSTTAPQAAPANDSQPKVAEAKELVIAKLKTNKNVSSFELAHELVEKYPYELYFADAVELAKDLCEVKRITDSVNDLSEVKNATDWNTINALLEKNKEQTQLAATIEMNAAQYFSQR
ncbi:MAG: hypothetical protein LBU90_03200 [Bacteroidales bacterium]|jgi:hypothetical protein|nr:hypothetical protein [Bacteroidales bacterium]